MATYIKPEAIQDVSKQAKKKLKSYISPKPIIVGRAIPRNAEVGDRYYTTSRRLIIKLPEDLRTKANAGVYRIETSGLYRAHIFKIPSNWPELYDLIIQALRNGGDIILNITPIIEDLQNQGYSKEVQNFTSTTACPNVMIENDRLVYNGAARINMELVGQTPENIANVLCGTYSPRANMVKIRNGVKRRKAGSPIKKHKFYTRPHFRDTTAGIKYFIDYSGTKLERSFIVAKIWRRYKVSTNITTVKVSRVRPVNSQRIFYWMYRIE